jgi:hypothetical protein
MTNHTPAASSADDAPADIREMLRLSQQQSDKMSSVFDRPTTIIVLTWGVAWFVGFLTLWSATEGNPWFRTPIVPAGIVFTVLMVAGIIVSAVVGSRTSRGMRGAVAFQGTVYGISWAIACMAVPFFGGALLANGMSPELAALFYPAGYSLVVGILYLAGAALWNDKPMLGVGIWIIVVGIGAPFFGAPTNYLVMGLLGGGAFLVYGVWLVLRQRRRVARYSRTDARAAVN